MPKKDILKYKHGDKSMNAHLLFMLTWVFS